MNILELDSYNLADAVKFNDQLNPRIWEGEKMRPEVRNKLLEIAADFKEFLGLSDLDVEDITISGSNAGFTYTPHSDIDLHLVVRMPEQCDEVYQELFNAKKYQYNDEHDIKIGGYDVELYVQPADQEHVSAGVYSVKNNDWIHIPRKVAATANDAIVKDKYELVKSAIDSALKSRDDAKMRKIWDKVKEMRQAGLAKNGELGPENLAFKMLRTQGDLGKLKDSIRRARDAELSLAEQNKEKKPFVYGYKNMAEDATATPDGVNPTTQMFLNEQDPVSDEDILKDFIDFVAKELKLKELPAIKLRRDPQWSVVHKTFGRYMDEKNTLEVAWGQRHIMDVLRTVAHELTHRRQHEREEVPMDAGETGSPYENEANARAGILMRDYARLHPEYFEAGQAKELHGDEIHEASGYIPTKKQANDPRFKMALTVDVHPGQTGKEANKMALKTNKQGQPELLIKSANLLEESLAEELQAFKEQDLFEIKMTGKNLAKLASDIKGAKVGLEFEMYVPNADIDDDGGDMEPDYDQDERVRDIDDCVSFFDDGDYNTSNELRRLRENMEQDYWEWKTEKIDEEWYGGSGFEYFQEYLDREEPYDRDEGLEEAEDYVRENNPDLEPGTDEYSEAVTERLNEMEAAYIQEQWDDQGYNFDRAREEYEEEHRDEWDETDWLRSEGIYNASDVEGHFGHVTWPYYTSSSDDGDPDIKRVALEFMNECGLPYDNVAISKNYHGKYELWDGEKWIDYGTEKPDFCFTLEPDGSLVYPNNRGDAGIEFVSPPVPLDQISNVMSKVQQWAASKGVYTGKSNKTSMHTNISIPGYSIKDLDYLKAALLLGDEHVLRQFDRIGNTYANPAIEKIKQLVANKPEKAQHLLDTMKNQLNAAASKILHSGVTDKFTSINTKDNRIEFRSPGGDYLSDIADNPKKMQDTINRMVVAMDAAMDPNKYKEEYQKKLYKILTGQAGGREAKTGAKQEPKKDTNDLLNIFSRYAAGELPKAALKSFVRQAQLQRKVAKGETKDKMWWNVEWNNGRRMEVVASNEQEAKDEAAKEWGIRPGSDIARSFTAKPLRPYGAPPAGSELERIEQQAGVGQQSTANHNWAIRNRETQEVLKTFQADGYHDAFEVLQQYKRDNNIDPSENYLTYGPYNPAEERAPQAIDTIAAFGATPIPGSTLDLQRQRAAQQAAGTRNFQLYNISTDEIIDTFPARNYDEAMIRLRDYQQHGDGQSNPDNFSVRPEPNVNSPTAINTSQGTGEGNWGIWIDGNNRFANQPGTYARGETPPLYRFPSREAAESWLEQQRAERVGMRTDIEVREIEPTRTPARDINLFPEIEPEQQSGVNNLTPRGPGPWEIYRISDGSSVLNLDHTNRNAAETEAITALNQRQEAPQLYGVRTRQLGGIINTANEPTTGNQVGQVYTPAGSGEFTGQWMVLDPNNTIIYKFGGIGNTQSDANRVAMEWLTRNPRQMVDGVTVVPEMG